MPDWPEYMSHKIVQAALIVDIKLGVSPDDVPVLLVQPKGGKVEEFSPTEPGMARRAEVGGYALRYEDGFKSVSPKKAFEEGYSAIRRGRPERPDVPGSTET
jgi:hypothetical protein